MNTMHGSKLAHPSQQTAMRLCTRGSVYMDMINVRELRMWGAGKWKMFTSYLEAVI